MYILKSNQKRCNPEAAYVTSEGVRHTKMPTDLYTEIPEPAAPEDYSTDYYYRTEQDDAPYVIYTRKSDEQIAQMEQGRINQTALAYLADTDWMVIRAAEDVTKPVSADVLQARSDARAAIVVVQPAI